MAAKAHKTTKPFDADISKVLNIVINSIYTNKDIFLRELISNASDATDKLKYLSLKDQELLKGGGDFKIEIKYDQDAKTITIRDYGIGMDEADLTEHLGTIANSGTGKFAKMLKEGGDAAGLIGQFGVGFYSGFMVSKLIEVKTRKAGSDRVFLWSSDGLSSYSYEEVKDADFKTGTQITLYLKPEEADRYVDKFEIIRIVKLYSNHIQYPIEFEEEPDSIKTINNTKALWLRDKKEITEEEYKEFYRQTASMADEPFFIIHNKVEGSIEYTNLLFVPSRKPFDLYAPDRKASVKLYANRVFITDNNTDILPEYLRFVKGVVDSPDLPLNISRETFQKNDKILKIRESLIKKIFSELKKKLKDDRSKYYKFWETFGNVIKEGLCDHSSDKEQIIETCIFKTTKSGEEYITLDEYVANMKPDQDCIYYITGEEYSDLAQSPQLEGFKKKDIEVILLTDSVDDFWVNVVIDHAGKDIKSITSKDVQPDGEDTEVKSEDEKNKNQQICEMFKMVLGGVIKDVKVSDKLVDSPACLSTEHGAMTIRMERYLYEQKQLPKLSAKVLEVNTNHPLVDGIFTRYQAAKQASGELVAKDKSLIHVIYDLACLTAGDFVAKPNEFAKKVLEVIG